MKEKKENEEFEIRTHVLAKESAEAFLTLLAPGWHEFTEEDDKILIGAEAEGKAVGVLLLTIIEEKRNCELEYLFVAEKYRRRKVGTALLNRALRVSRQFESESLKCMVVGEEETGVDALLKSWGMECGEEDHGLLGRITLADIVKKAVFPDLENDHVFSLRDVRKAALNNCDSHLCGLHGWDVLDQELSCLYVKEDKALASFLVRRLGNDLVVEWMAILPGENALLLLKTISFSLETAIKKYPPETEVVYSVWNEAAEKLIAYMFKNDKREELPASCYRLEGTDYSLKFCPYEAWETTEGE